MRAILIDPFERTVTEVELAGFAAFAPAMQCEIVQPVHMGSHEGLNHSLLVDEEGMFKAERRPFAIRQNKGEPVPFVNRALVVGDAGSEFVAATSPLELVERAVVWLAAGVTLRARPPLVVGCSDPDLVARFLT